MKDIKPCAPPACFPCTLSTWCLGMHIKLFSMSFTLRYVAQQGTWELDGCNHPGCCGCCFLCWTIDLTATWCFPGLPVGLAQSSCLSTAQPWAQGWVGLCASLQEKSSMRKLWPMVSLQYKHTGMVPSKYARV